MNEGNVKVRFLGGALDHTIREVKADPLDQRIPMDDVYVYMPQRRVAAPTILDHLTPPLPPPQMEEYRLRHIQSGPWEWWAYILRGYDPPRIHVLDTCPISI